MARVFPSAECVGYSEINRFPVMMYQRSFPSHKNYGDISKIDAESLPCFDMLVGGFPCQPHSRIGNKKGFNDPRGKLFFDVIRIAEVKKPKFIVLENVEGLATGKDGEEKMNVVLGSIIKAGYRPSYRLLNASEYCDIPQARKRLFIIGIRDDIYKEGFRYRWPDKSPCKVTFADILDKPGEIDSSLVYSAKQIDSLFRESKGKERIERGFHQDSERMYARTVVANIHKGFPCDVIIDRNLCQHGFFGCEFAGSDE